MEKWVFISLLVAIGYGIAGYLTKLVLKDTGNASYLMLLALFQVLVASLWKFFNKDQIPKIKNSSFVFAFIGITLFNLGNIVYFIALEKGLASIVVPLSNTYIIITVLLSVFLLGEKIYFHQTAGIISVICGVILVGFNSTYIVSNRIVTQNVTDESIRRPVTNRTNEDTLVKKEKAMVSYVYDRDTVLLSNGRKFRYIGINTPEITKGKTAYECFSNEALSINKQLVNGQTIEIEKDTSDYDKYGRLLRYIWVDGVFVNEFLVRQGYAKLEIIPPNFRYAKILKDAQNDAEINKRGMWGKCG